MPERFIILLATIGFAFSGAVLWSGDASAGSSLEQVGLAAAVASVVSLGLLALRAVLTMLSTTRRRNIFDCLMSSNPASTVLVDAQGRTLLTNDRYDSGHHLPRCAQLSDALTAICSDPLGEIKKLHQQCDLNGHTEEMFTSGPVPLLITVRKTRRGVYLWEIADAPLYMAHTTHANNVPVASFDTDGALLSRNDAFNLAFPLNVETLTDLSGAIANRTDQRVPLTTIHGKRLFDLKFLQGEKGAGTVFCFEREFQKTQPALPDAEIFEKLTVPLMWLNLNGTVLAINPAARAILRGGVNVGSKLNTAFTSATRPLDEWLEEARDSGRSPQPEFLSRQGQGDELILQAMLTRLGEEAPYLICTLTDVTELKSLEAQFVQSQKMQAIGQLAGGVAHDFNNLLTAISGHCDLLLMRHDPTDPEHADLMQIHQNTNRAASLVGQLLAFSRKQNLQFQSLNLRDTLADLGHLLNRLVGEKVELSLDHGSDLNLVRADKRQLEQVMMNLVVNARDAMPDGGVVQIKTSGLNLVTPTEMGSAVVQPGEYVKISVIDQGEGIAPELIDKVFEPFVTTKRTGEGTGLGLSTVYGIVKQSGGYIFVDSVLGKGTKFDVILPAPPVRAAVVEPVEEEPPKTEFRPSDGVVLLVEDEAPVRAFASRALQLKGYKVIEADCAEMALDLLQDEDMHVDVFVTDVIMPGLDGPTWVTQAKAIRPDVRVIFVSGYAEDSFSSQKDAFENAAFLPKPFSLKDLTRTVDSVLS